MGFYYYDYFQRVHLAATDIHYSQKTLLERRASNMTCVRSGVSLGVLARPVPRRTATERRAACFGICSHLRLPAAVRAHWLARAEKKITPYLVLYLLFLLNALLATSRWPLVKPRGLTPVCGSGEPRLRWQPSQSETE